MDINKNLKEYGKLNLQLQEVNQKIDEIIDTYRKDKKSVQLFDYIDWGNTNYWTISIERWAHNNKKTVDKMTYDLMELIKQKKTLKRKIYYRNKNIIRYAIDMAKEL